jgi:O-antigen/teichoic acid export membrane protein
VWLLTGAVSTALLPHLTNAPERDPGLPAVVARHVIIWTGLGSGLLFALAGILVPLFYSSAFADVVAPLRWLLPGVLTLSVGKVLVAELLAREQVRVTMWIAAAAVVINVIGNLALIPSMGISGAAAASSISYSVVAVLVTVAYVRETGISVWMIVPRPSDARAYIGLCRHFWDLRRVAQVRV